MFRQSARRRRAGPCLGARGAVRIDARYSRGCNGAGCGRVRRKLSAEISEVPSLVSSEVPSPACILAAMTKRCARLPAPPPHPRAPTPGPPSAGGPSHTTPKTSSRGGPRRSTSTRSDEAARMGTQWRSRASPTRRTYCSGPTRGPRKLTCPASSDGSFLRPALALSASESLPGKGSGPADGMASHAPPKRLRTSPRPVGVGAVRAQVTGGQGGQRVPTQIRR